MRSGLSSRATAGPRPPEDGQGQVHGGHDVPPGRIFRRRGGQGRPRGAKRKQPLPDMPSCPPGNCLGCPQARKRARGTVQRLAWRGMAINARRSSPSPETKGWSRSICGVVTQKDIRSHPTWPLKKSGSRSELSCGGICEGGLTPPLYVVGTFSIFEN